jgi:NADH-quinone oxidoreductase subunit H
MAYVIKLLPLAIVLGGVLSVVPILVYLERKISAWIQDRIGPNRVGLLGPDSPLEIFGIRGTKSRILGGWLQPLADVVKLITKETLIPARVDRVLYTMAPFFALLPPLLAFIVIPVGPDIKLGGLPVELQVADLNVGILWVLGVASLSAYGVAFGGWASNNKYALLGGVRAMAQMLSYEIGLGLVILSMVMTYDTVSLRSMVMQQAGGGVLGWGVFHQPLAFILFVVCAFAENNRLPFDLAECDAELVGGYHTEYNSLHFGMFFQGEYIAMLAMGALTATLFFGGWHYPFYHAMAAQSQILAALVGLAAFGLKVMAFICLSMWVRWTLPRFRWDQLMNIGWRGLVPLGLANLMLTAILRLPAIQPPPPAAKAALTERMK